MNTTSFSRPVVAILGILLLSPAMGAESIDEIIVTADFRSRPASELPSSVTVIDAEQVNSLAVQHFEELVNVVPNLNWSGDGHRARYFQIRGVGELEQYQGAPNPSVGFLIDDIDFSGIGTIATLFDVERVEVLRGPQGSRYGANALAGLVYLQSTMPTPEQNGRLTLGVGDDDMRSVGIAFGGKLRDDERALFRLSAHHHQSNGFRDNSHLGREDTNGRDELTVRGRLKIAAGDTVEINVAALFTEVDNGYDAFALDNSYTVLSDKPGRDAQESIGLSVKIAWNGLHDKTFSSTTAFADSNIDFSFDADWGNETSWAPFTYDFVSLNDRSRRTLSQEFRIASDSDSSSSWLFGLYALRLDDDLATVNRGDYFDPFFNFAINLDDAFGSSYEATNVAAFGQFEYLLSPGTRLSLGLRVENRSSNYSDTAALLADPSETMTGGELMLSHDHGRHLTSYFGIAKGYKAGGFNLGIVPDDRREFDEESLWSVEAGVKSLWLEQALGVNLSVFYNERNDQQVRPSFQLNRNDPASFGFATINANGDTAGLEAEIRWLPTENVELYVNLAWLDASIDRFELPGFVFEQRDQAHAPAYTFAAGAVYRHSSGWFTRADLSGKDSYYFDVSHDQQSDSYVLTNARLGFEADSWTAQVWVRNLFDERYAVRGFFFGNEPPNFPPTLYTRLGDARQFGIKFDKRFGS